MFDLLEMAVQSVDEGNRIHRGQNGRGAPGAEETEDGHGQVGQLGSGHGAVVDDADKEEEDERAMRGVAEVRARVECPRLRKAVHQVISYTNQAFVTPCEEGGKECQQRRGSMDCAVQ